MRLGRYLLVTVVLLVAGTLAAGAATATPARVALAKAPAKGPSAAPHTHEVPGRIEALSCGSRSTCYAIASVRRVSRTGIIRITDKGAHSHTTLVKETISASAISCPSAAGCEVLIERRSDDASLVAPVSGKGAIGKPRGLGTTPSVEPSLLTCHQSRTHCILLGASGGIVDAVSIDGSTSSNNALTLPANHVIEAINGLTCPTATQCYAVGQASVNAKQRGFVLPIHNGVVGAPTYVASASDHGLQAIACPSAATCYATGFGHHGLVFTVHNAKVTHTATIPKVVAMYGIACPSVHRCLAAGVDVNQTNGSMKGALVPIHNGKPGAVQTNSAVSAYGGEDGALDPVAGFRGLIEIAGVDNAHQYKTVISSN
jgi:hypothetical protein